ncbi:hypothetical protein CVS40_12031 [Lucilia cuprina]|nr:hypothetical protein CVS40_12031 [Lucilia cuprina]
MSNGVVYHVYCIPLLILGDNLGLNSLLGFSKSFNGCFCRFCNINKSLSQTSSSDIIELRRNYASYDRDLKLKKPKETGIAHEREFNKIPSFHVIDNLSVDAMHDVLERVCHYDMSQAISYFINKKYFTHDTLNHRK